MKPRGSLEKLCLLSIPVSAQYETIFREIRQSAPQGLSQSDEYSRNAALGTPI